MVFVFVFFVCFVFFFLFGADDESPAVAEKGEM